MINYINERTGASITASYNSDYMEEGSSYDVNALLNKAIDGYTWIRYEGGQPAGSLMVIWYSMYIITAILLLTEAAALVVEAAAEAMVLLSQAMEVLE